MTRHAGEIHSLLLAATLALLAAAGHCLAAGDESHDANGPVDANEPAFVFETESDPNVLTPTAHYPDKASEGERKALDALAKEVRGRFAWSRKGKVYATILGDWRPVDLGRGEFIRIAPDGKRFAVYHKGDIYVVDPNGRREKVAGGADSKHGCPIDFHPDNRRIVFWTSRHGFRTVDVNTGDVETLDLPGKYTGSPGFSADGTKMTVRDGGNLYAIDVERKRHRKYARGCSPGVSPDGELLMNNTGGHRTMDIRTWEGKKKRRIDVRTCKPDRSWDNHHWSNHDDYIAAQGDGKGHESYVVKISENRCTRITFAGKTAYPDVWIAPPVEEEEASQDRDDEEESGQT